MITKSVDLKKSRLPDIEQKIVTNPSMVLREESDQWAILYDPDTGDTFGLNPVSVSVWKLLDGSHTVREIIGNVQEYFSGVPGEVEGDVREFIGTLLDKGYALQVGDGSRIEC